MLEKTLGTVTIATLCCAAFFAARADDPPSDAPRCLQLTRIDHTEAVSDRDVLFYLKDRSIYRNALPQVCNGLRAGKPFQYRVVLDQLCDTDTITLLDEQGAGFVPAQTCLLGPFEKIDATSVESLKTSEKANERERRQRRDRR